VKLKSGEPVKSADGRYICKSCKGNGKGLKSGWCGRCGGDGTVRDERDALRSEWQDAYPACTTDPNLDPALLDPRDELIEKLLDEVALWRRCYLDKPEDRLYHASDKTWWRRDDTNVVGRLLRADPPPEVQDTDKELRRLRKVVQAASRAARAGKKKGGK
jgi:hypothetical protein